MTEKIFLFVYDGVQSANKKNIVSLIVVSIMGVAELISTLILFFLAKRISRKDPANQYKLSYIDDDDEPKKH